MYLDFSHTGFTVIDTIGRSDADWLAA